MSCSTLCDVETADRRLTGRARPSTCLCATSARPSTLNWQFDQTSKRLLRQEINILPAGQPPVPTTPDDPPAAESRVFVAWSSCYPLRMKLLRRKTLRTLWQRTQRLPAAATIPAAVGTKHPWLQREWSANARMIFRLISALETHLLLICLTISKGISQALIQTYPESALVGITWDTSGYLSSGGKNV